MAFGIERVEHALKKLGDALHQGLTENRTLIIDAVSAHRGDLAGRIDDTRLKTEANGKEIAAARREIAQLHALVEAWRADVAEARTAPREEDSPGVHGPEGDECGHHDLLAQVAGIAGAQLVCHRDTWAFLTEHAGRGEHFRMPVDITHARNGVVEVELSGRTLIAVTDALWEVTRTRGLAPGTHQLAAQTYNRIHGALAHSATCEEGAPVRIAIDDRRPPGGKDPDRAAP